MKLFKYVVSERIDILEDGFIRFTQPQMLNDPNEFKPHISSLANNTQLNEILTNDNIEEIINEEINKMPENVRSQARYIFYSRDNKQHLNDLFLEGFRSYIKEDNLIDDINKVIHSGFEKSIGILSLTGVENNDLMWAHYAGGHTGFVIEFNSENNFFNQKKSKDDKFRHVVKIKYQEMQKFNFYDMDINSLMAKEQVWKYEDEYRMVFALQDASKVINKNIYLFKLPFNAIKSIILGRRVSDDLKQKIKNLVNTKERSHIKLFESNIIRGSLCKNRVIL